MHVRVCCNPTSPAALRQLPLHSQPSFLLRRPTPSPNEFLLAVRAAVPRDCAIIARNAHRAAHSNHQQPPPSHPRLASDRSARAETGLLKSLVRRCAEPELMHPRCARPAAPACSMHGTWKTGQMAQPTAFPPAAHTHSHSMSRIARCGPQAQRPPASYPKRATRAPPHAHARGARARRTRGAALIRGVMPTSLYSAYSGPSALP